MYRLLIKQFFSSKTTRLTFGLLLILGVISIVIGKQFLDMQNDNFSKIIVEQGKHIEDRLEKSDNMGSVMYHAKFSFVNHLDNLAGIAIGQRDLNANIQSICVLNLESQRYNTDLVNPMRLQVGNLDLSFIIIFLFPLIIISLNFNLLSEEVEKGTWKMIKVQGKSPLSFLLMKLSVRFLFVVLALLLLFVIAKFTMNIAFSIPFISIISLSVLYLIFWFCISLVVISFKNSSNFNAVSLLIVWLLLVIIFPVTVSKIVTAKYPIGEALSLTIKQRDGYHQKWDTDKTATMNKFYKHYPQYKKYGIDKEFSWVWYYAMQQMGDDDSKLERDAMFQKIASRQSLSEQIAVFLPSIKMQLAINELAQTDLKNYIGYLNATTSFHEKLRLNFYPKIFDQVAPKSVNWGSYKPEYYKPNSLFNFFNAILPMLLITLLLLGVGIFKLKKL